MPVVHNISHKGLPLGAVYVGRQTRRFGYSPYGNPFQIGPDGTRQQVIAKYEQWLRDRPALIAKAKKELKDKDLACWCAPLPCHANVLLRVVSEDD